jgi:hypothetical protein
MGIKKFGETAQMEIKFSYQKNEDDSEKQCQETKT